MKLSIHKNKSKKGFTLIELLVVIAIIATLGALSYGPIMKHIRSADVLNAKKVCKDLTFAIDGFEQTYDSLPYTGSYPSTDESYVTDTSGFLNVLMGKDTDINDRGKKFFTSDEGKGGKNGLIYDGGNLTSLVDKWGKPYTIKLDYDGDGVIDATTIGTGSSYKEFLHVENSIAASPTYDGEFNDVGDAKSW